MSTNEQATNVITNWFTSKGWPVENYRLIGPYGGSVSIIELVQELEAKGLLVIDQEP